MACLAAAFATHDSLADSSADSNGLAAGVDHNQPVGLSLWFEEGQVKRVTGQVKPVELYENFPRYVQELDITSSVETTTDQGIQPVIDSGDMAGLDWSGVEQVDEDWRPNFDGTFNRTRFYRNARWMERFSVFAVVPVNQNNQPVGPPIAEIAGSDDHWGPADDTFIRRFDARQVTYGCPTRGDCTGATRFQAQGLAQVRDALHAEERAQRIPKAAKKLMVVWTEDIDHPRFVDIEHKKYSETPYRYGFQPKIEVSSTPANGQFFMPGEAIDFRISLYDGAGNKLNADGALPNYQDFLDDNIPYGLRYYDGLRQELTLYYALKHREGLTILSFQGPTDKVKLSHHEIGLFDYFGPQATTAKASEDGFTGEATLWPAMATEAIPELRSLPVSDTVHMVIPADAQPGTYTVAFKARRDWGGEALNRSTVAEFQVGQTAATGFHPTTGNCQSCHQGDTSLSKVLHGLGDRRTCDGCHVKMAFEYDHVLDYRIHLIHSRSERFPGDANNCSTCHLTPPSGEPRGFPGHEF